MIILGRGDKQKAIVRLLAARLEDEDQEVRRKVIRSSTKLASEEAVPVDISRITLRHLISALQHQDHSTRQMVAEVLGRLGDAQAVKPLEATLDDEGESVRRAAIRALGRIWGLKEVIDLGDEDADVRCRAAEALGRLGDERALKPLIATRQDRDKKVQQAAERSISHIEDLIWQ